MSTNKPHEKVEAHDADRTSLRAVVDVTVNERRRRLAKFAVGAPVLVTLASRPVLAGQCLSNMMSGNLSDPNRGLCSKGWSPGGWGEVGGTVSSYSTIGAWSAVSLTYGVYDVVICNPGANPNRTACYKLGSTLANVPSVLNQDSLVTTTPLRDILNDPQDSQLTRHLVCAYLNALLGALPGSTFHYILTPQQVVDLANLAPLPPPFTDLQTFLGSTW